MVHGVFVVVLNNIDDLLDYDGDNEIILKKERK